MFVIQQPVDISYQNGFNKLHCSPIMGLGWQDVLKEASELLN